MLEISLVRLGEIYAAHRQISPSRVGFLAADDGKFFQRLNSGKTCTLRTANRVLQWFSDNWPEHLEWPPDVPRPEPTPAGEETAA